ncbi:hypothetical protein BUALT_Bualt14G0078100 [Buddleja alternifolia]|uniref:Uncharacterized protein n=1 Tax=Buddleja alternifolia TaxID=168488 RepID=A0AAV6WSZ2_9LAMI|nr:hypothetical protein BUALT_Bualt14G0078100 [Buddleja alternifolia]
MIRMAYFHSIITLILISSSTILSIPSDNFIPTISAAPALLPNPPLSPYTELSPDITPLLPSPGGTARSPDRSSLPTIPSSHSPPNPDTTSSIGPDTAVAPSGALQDSSAVSLLKGFEVEVFSSCLAYWLVMVFMM